MTVPKKFLKPLPHLPVKNLSKTIAYYKNKLGFTDAWTFGEKDGGVKKDDLRLLFVEDPGFTNIINNEKHRLPVIWFVENIEAIYKEFQERSIEIIDPIKEHPYGLREFAFIDINGYYIRIAENTPD